MSGATLLQILVLVGLALLAMAVAWRTVRLARVRRACRAGLTHEDPAVRAAAVRQAAELGLAATAPVAAACGPRRDRTRPCWPP